MQLIPGKFVRKYGEGLLNRAVLKVPSGLVWDVELVRDEIGVWFSKNGWQEFAESHSLKYGSFLVFEYEGSSMFSVIICDKTATEIEYPITKKQPNKLFSEPKVEQFEDAFDLPQINKGKSPMEYTRTRKKMRGSITVNAMGGSWSHDLVPADDSYQVGEKKVGSSKNQIAGRPHSGSQRLGGNMMKLALEKASPEEKEGADKRIYEDEEPSLVRKRYPRTELSSQHPSFSIQITSKMLTRKDLHLPVSFTAMHFGKDDKLVKLQVADKTWSVALIRYNSKYVYFSDDWNLFIKENSLNPGDVCVFEYVERMLLKVTIFRKC
ncbi:B3 domain-containing transcription factor VRN1 [Linum perenne]